MLRYFLKRAALVVPTFLGITAVCFALTQFVPGGPVERAMLSMRGLGGGGSAAVAQAAASARGSAPRAVTDEVRRSLERRFGFDKPLHVRYWNWLVRDRCGLRTPSTLTGKPAWEAIRERIPVSLWFGIPGFFLTYLVCVPLGIAKAVRRGTAFDWASSAAVFAGYAIPTFALGMVLKTLLCGTVDGFPDLFPAGGAESEAAAALSAWGRFADRLHHAALPVLCYVAGSFAMLTLLMKNSLLDQMASDYVRTVLAKGATVRRAVWGHALRNALVPLATGFGGILTVMFAGSVIVETVFDIPGMGKLSLQALESRDYPVFMGLLSVTSMLGLAGQILSDLCYAAIDPRIRFDRN